MSYEQYNAFCRSLPATTYVMQWGQSHVWKVGGKVFAIGGWEQQVGVPAFTFKVSDYHFDLLQEQQGYRPAPYMASRGMKWIQQIGQGHDDDALEYYLVESHRLVSLGLTKKRQKELGLNQ